MTIMDGARQQQQPNQQQKRGSLSVANGGGGGARSATASPLPAAVYGPSTSGGVASGGGGQFPASFPDSFKDFFAMLNEEDDHVDVFSNILEDKDIPRSTKCRYSRTAANAGGGSTGYGPAPPHSATGSYSGGGRSGSFSLSASNAGAGNNNFNFGRSSSFRLHRNKPPSSLYTDHHQQNSSQQLLINNIRNQLGGSGLIPTSAASADSGEEDRTMKNLSLIKSAIVDRSPSSSALASLSVTGFAGPGSINRSKSNTKIDDRSPSSFEMKSFEFGGGGAAVTGTGSSGPTAGSRSYKISENSDEVEEDTLNAATGNKSLASKMTKTTTSYCFLRHHQQQQQQQSQQAKPPHSRNNSLRVHRSTAGAPVSPSASFAPVFGQAKSPHGGSCSSFAGSGSTQQLPTGCPTGTCLPLGGNSCCCSKDFLKHQKSPVFNRRRSSSISVARPTPDLYRFLKAEVPPAMQQPLASPGARFPPLTASSKGSALASSTSTMSTLVESVSGVSSATAPPDSLGPPKDHPYLTSSPSNSRLKQQQDGGGDRPASAVPPAGTKSASSSRFQSNNEENDGNFSNLHQQQQQQHPVRHHPPAHRTVSISTTAIVCGGGGGYDRTAVTTGGGSAEARQRMRTSSMPVENNRKPRLADTRRSAIHCADMDIEYYRLRSFSITSHGICNLGDSMRSRRSRSINSVTSNGSGGAKDRKGSSGSQKQDDKMADGDGEGGDGKDGKEKGGKDGKDKQNAYKVAMLGASGVGKTALTYQFTTSEYICAYDLSLDDDYGQKTVSVLLDGHETDLEIIDHPACEMSEEAFCSTYHIDIFVVVYSVVDRGSFKKAEKILHFLRDGEMLLTRGVILVGNKTDLERQREVPTQVARRLAKEIGAKFIETSSGMDYNVDELLVGITAQVKLNPQRVNRLTDKQRNSIAGLPYEPRSVTPMKGRKTAMSMRELTSSGRDASGRMRRILRRGSIGKFGSEDDDDYDLGDKRLRKKTTSDFLRNDDDGESDDERSTDNETNLLRRKRYDAVQLPSCSTTNLTQNQSSTNRFLKRLSFDDQMQQDTQDLVGGGQDGSSRHGSPQPSIKRFNFIDADSTHGTSTSCTGGAPSTAANKFANRTKLLLTSFLKFKRNLRVKRRSSGSCSDLFVI
ncbi:hypothetical protein pipiens_001232 [Culex pipiens pipiens]|uniref:Uncharacterized protein n=1 Tax=Culex pipiens pipiens TaxID=38569 RepID=A0ABD1DBM4_CULPP